MICPLFALLLLAAPLAAQTPDTTRPSLIPWPASYRADSGRWMPVGAVTVSGPAGQTAEQRELASLTRLTLQESFGIPARAAAAGRPADVTVRIRPGPVADSLRESYRLRVTPRGITIEARSGAGIFYALQTLRQLAASAGNGAGRGLPAVDISDRPRFKWRGLHLDVVRHFYSVEFVKRYIDLMARYKYNTFHWHLTDDQGWRIEINGYPRLTSVGAWRKETIKGKNFNPYIGDSIPYGGYYTQAEIREVVRYAAERFVTVVPEIEMPGHAKAAVAAYPELACTPGPFEVGTIWGVEDDIFCPTEHTFKVLEDVLTQVMALFPSKYIHVGGDEVPKVRWKNSEFVQALMRREGLKNEEEVQNWFISRIERFLNAHGRRLIGWDEIIDGGIAPEATVMSWRGIAGGITAARAGHDVVMTPGSHVYFDHLQGDPRTEPLSIGGYSPLEKVYAFEPVPTELTAAQARHILGAQANMWNEYVATEAHIEYMIWPRALALSEVLWSPLAARDWNSFATRLPGALTLLDTRRVNYRIPDVFGLEGDKLILADSGTVALRALANGTVRYTLDGSVPNATSPTYTAPFTIPLTKEGTTVTARLEVRDGRLGAPRRALWRKAVYQDAQRSDTAGLTHSLNYKYGEGRSDSTGGVARLNVTRSGTVATVQLRGDETADRFGVTLEGWIRVPGDGIWEFSLTSDDGSVLYIDDQKVVDNDGYHGPDAKEGAVPLRGGLHKIRVVMFQGGGAKALSLGWRRQGETTFAPVQAESLWH
jgi:hexosaminidase